MNSTGIQLNMKLNFMDMKYQKGKNLKEKIRHRCFYCVKYDGFQEAENEYILKKTETDFIKHKQHLLKQYIYITNKNIVFNKL